MRYRLTDEEYERILKASKPRMKVLGGRHKPPPPRETVLDEWRKVAERVGCDPETIRPVSFRSMRDFEATPITGGDDDHA